MPPLTKATSKEDIKQAFDEIEDYVDGEDDSLSERRKSKVIGWAISGMTHALFVLIFSFVVYAQMEEKVEHQPIRIAMMDPPKPIDDVKKRELIEVNKQVEIDVDKPAVDNPIVTQLEPIPEELNTESEDQKDSVAKGREEAVSDVEAGGTAAFLNIGAGGQASGILGNRSGWGKIRARGQLGPHGKAADAATDAGLRWLKKHQSPNGSWDAVNYVKNCTEDVKCEPGNLQAGDTNVALTSLSVLCFISSGYDHKTPNKYSKVVTKGLEYLLSVQKKDGTFGERNYEHSIALMAIAETYAMTSDPILRVPAQNAVNVLLSRQSTDGTNNTAYNKLAWDYLVPNPGRNDTSASGWCALSLKSALAAGLQVKDGLDGVKKWVELSWKSANPDWKKLDPYGKSVFPYTYNGISDKVEKDHLSAVGSLCAIFTGAHSGNIMLETMMNDAKERWIDSGNFKNNDYMVYYLSLSMFQMGKDKWDAFLNKVVPYIIEKQRVSTDCFDGSWDYSHQQYHGHATGRVLSTCFNVLSLEVAYRYIKVK